MRAVRKSMVLATGMAIINVLAGPSFAGNIARTVDAGGQRTTSANYTMDGSLGGIGDISTGGGIALKGGYIGQLTEVTNLAVTTAPGSVNEGGSSQLGGLAGLDDATVVAIEGSNIVWSLPVYPVAAIGSAGVATAALVYADATGVVTGRYLGVAGAGVILVLNGNPDNFGLYAGDQVPDDWQVRYFGINNPNGAASSTNATGQNNLYAYIADLCPTNPNSCFEIVAISNRPPTNTVCFLSSSNRLYRLEWTTNLIAGGWTNTPGVTPVAGNGGVFWLNDTNAPSPRFYKVSVRVP